MDQKTRFGTLVTWMIRNPGVALPSLAAAGAILYFAVIDGPYLLYKGSHGWQFGQSELQKAQGDAEQARAQGEAQSGRSNTYLPSQIQADIDREAERIKHGAADGGECNPSLKPLPPNTPKAKISAHTDRQTVPCVSGRV